MKDVFFRKVVYSGIIATGIAGTIVMAFVILTQIVELRKTEDFFKGGKGIVSSISTYSYKDGDNEYFLKLQNEKDSLDLVQVEYISGKQFFPKEGDSVLFRMDERKRIITQLSVNGKEVLSLNDYFKGLLNALLIMFIPLFIFLGMLIWGIWRTKFMNRNKRY